MNEQLFTGKAEVYAKFRPGYPREVIDLAVSRLSLSPADVIADIGAGTGIFTAQLIKTGCRVIAVEPNPDMAEQLAKNAPEAEIVRASAEDTGITEHSVRLVTAATAFHWFDTDRFRAECSRILTEDGAVMLLWNTADESSLIIKELSEIKRRFCEGYPLKNTGADKERFFAEYTEMSFGNPLCFDLEGFVGNQLSRSYTPKEGDELYEPYKAALTEFFAEHADGDVINIPNVTECYFGRV